MGVGTLLGVVVVVFAYSVAGIVHKQDHFVPIALYGIFMYLIGLISAAVLTAKGGF